MLGRYEALRGETSGEHSIVPIKVVTHGHPDDDSYREGEAYGGTFLRAVVQRVSRGSVSVGGDVLGRIGPGFVVLLGVKTGDTVDNAQYLAEKIANLRVFEDEEGKMNRSILEVGGEVLAVSQFTLYGDCRKGRRPSFTEAAPPAEAEALYEKFVAILRETGLRVATGKFQAMMSVEIINDGPVTILLDSGKVF